VSPSANITPVVVVGGGLAAVSFASTLRQGGYAGPLQVVADDPELPYDRPPLSKGFILDGDTQRIRLDLARARDVEWLLGVRATAIDRRGRTLALSNGRRIAWGTLVLATGTRARMLGGLEPLRRPVVHLRTLDDASQLRLQLGPASRLLVLGAGVIGLEVAATARSLGVHVTVVEPQARVMARTVPASVSRGLEQRHIAEGVDLRLGRTVASASDGQVVLSDGTCVVADAVLAGIGVVPNDELADAADIACHDGVITDAFGRTSADGVLAVGDVARQPHPISGELQRIETWANAQNQAAACARAWLDPDAPPYADAPWFWSDQYDIRLQGVGLPTGPREVLRGSVAEGRCAWLQFDDRRLVGATCLNTAKDFGVLRKLVGRTFEADADTWSDPSIDLRKIA